MKMIEHTIDLHGPGCHGKFARPEAIGAVLARVKPTIRETLRMGFLGSSRLVGRPIRELRAIGEILFGGQSKGPDDSTRLHFKAPILRSAAPQLFEQELLWQHSLQPDDTAFDLVGDLLKDVSKGVKESERFDSDLLRRVAGFDFALRQGISELKFHGHRNDSSTNVPEINECVTQSAKTLYDETPRPTRARVAGRLDMIRISDRAFDLLLQDGRKIRAVWAQPEIVGLRDFLGSSVVIEGLAIYRPSGAVLRIDASAIAAARTEDSLFSTIPQPGSGKLDVKLLSRPQNQKSGVNAIWGTWPGTETEQELLDALREVR